MKSLLDAIEIRPRSCVMEVTSKCNFHCLHCASSAGPDRTRGPELNLDEILQVLDDLVSLGCERLTLSGGEALLRNDWSDIAKAAVTRGIRVSLISNGYLLNSHMARAIRNCGISLVALSIDGTETTHNYIRCNRKSYTHVLEAASALADAGILCNFITAVTKANIHELSDIEDTVAGMNANRWLIQLGSPLGRLGEHPRLVVSPVDLPTVADFIVDAKLRARVPISVGDNIGYFSHHEHIIRATPERGDIDFFCGCSAGCLNVGIEANGNVKGCLSLQADEFIEGNVRHDSLVSIWNKPGNFAYTRQFSTDRLSEACRACDYGELCRGGCTFMSFGATGKPHCGPYCLRTVLGTHSMPRQGPVP